MLVLGKAYICSMGITKAGESRTLIAAAHHAREGPPLPHARRRPLSCPVFVVSGVFRLMNTLLMQLTTSRNLVCPGVDIRCHAC